jgi:hypothetical protein
LRGEGELIDDLAALVDGMDKPLDETARAFLKTIGSAAKASAKREARPTPSARRTPAPAKAQPSPEAPLARPVDLSEMLRRRRERERAARLEQFGRYNDEAWREQQAFLAANSMQKDAGWGGW